MAATAPDHGWVRLERLAPATRMAKWATRSGARRLDRALQLYRESRCHLFAFNCLGDAAENPDLNTLRRIDKGLLR